MAERLIQSLATTGPLAELFSDRSILAAMLRFEGALARVEGGMGIIPRKAAAVISAMAKNETLSAAAIAGEAPRSGTVAIPFLRAFREKVRAHNPAAAGYLHWGATSQDVCDTGLMLVLQGARRVLQADVRKLDQALLRLSHRHRGTVMLGRTWLQPAPPVTFGLKVAGWLGAVRRSARRLDTAFDEALVLQFGGASGTLAALGPDGPRVGRAMAKELRLGWPEAPWHTHRDRLAALACACGVLSGSLGKMARDILLLAQHEVAEVREQTGRGRGSSSTMPHKQNPVSCVLAAAAAQRTPGLVSGFLAAMAQEHERAAGGWQAEWPMIAELIQSTGLALESMTAAAEGLIVDEARMRQNLEATGGVIFAERAAFLLSRALGRDRAHHLLEEASRKAMEQGRRLREVLAGSGEIVRHVSGAELRDLEEPERYLGAAEEFRLALLGAGLRRQPARGKRKVAAARKVKSGRKG